jgi:tetrahydromethanopterin S-methyltransferase subunit G
LGVDVMFKKIFFSIGILFGLVAGLALGYYLMRNAFAFFDRLIAVF